MIRKWFRRKPLNVLEGGTGANVPEKACENLGAVKKTGDIITGNLEFYGENEAGESFIHPVVNAKAGNEGIDVVIGGSDNKSSLVVGCGKWANKAAEIETNLEDGNLSLTANDSIRLFQKRSRADGSEYLAERWRFNASGYLTHRNAYDQQNYYPFQFVRTFEEDENQTDRFIGGLKLNSSLDPNLEDYIQGHDTMIGIESRSAIKDAPTHTNTLLLGVSDKNKKIVSFRNGIPNTINRDSGKNSAEAWRNALISDEGYGVSGKDADSIKAWKKWLGMVDSNKAVAPNTYLKYYLKNGLCTLYGGSSDKTIGKSGTKIATLPAAARPKMEIQGALSTTTNNCGQFRITTAGVVTLWNFSGSSGYWTFTVTYPVA